MRKCWSWVGWSGLLLIGLTGCVSSTPPKESGAAGVYVVPIRNQIMPPLVYLVRRGVKEAMENGARALVVDMNTDGGRVDVTEEIIEILNEFEGQTVTYVNDRAFSAGAFIAVATQRIYMAPQSVIGAAAPVMMVPGGGVQEMPDTMELKMTSAVRALVRRMAEKNGHNIDVVEAMIDKNKKLVVDGEVLSPEGEILTLTDTEAAREYGEPPKPLLSAGTVSSLDELLENLGFEESERVLVEATGAEQIAFWINRLSPLLLILGVLGLYLEFKTPGFGLPGIAGITAFALYFFGSYVAGLSGMEWLLVFIVGVILVGLELFVFPGTLFLGLSGAGLMLAAIVMAMVDMYPGGPLLPSAPQLRVPLQKLTIALAGGTLAVWIASLLLPRTTVYQQLVSHSVSGESPATPIQEETAAKIGDVGVTVSALHPGGKAQFGIRLLSVVSQGELIPPGSRVRVIGYSGRDPIVEPVR